MIQLGHAVCNWGLLAPVTGRELGQCRRTLALAPGGVGGVLVIVSHPAGWPPGRRVVLYRPGCIPPG